jgi:hypothetical protein
MRKYALLLLVVLGISSTALGVCRINLCIDPIECGQPVTSTLDICCSGECTYAKDPVVRPCGRTIYVDVCLTCTCLDGFGPVEQKQPELLGADACCGLYIVVVRVWCTYDGCQCWPYSMFRQPLLCGMTSRTLVVCCDDCGCFPCRCGFYWPCCQQINEQ